MAESMSLLLALLGVDPVKGVNRAAAASAQGPNSPIAKYNAIPEEDQTQVLEALYKVLYLIIEEHERPSNKAINRAIGKALARAIHKHIPGLEPDTDFVRICDILKPVVTVAIEELYKTRFPTPQV